MAAAGAFSYPPRYFYASSIIAIRQAVHKGGAYSPNILRILPFLGPPTNLLSGTSTRKHVQVAIAGKHVVLGPGGSVIGKNVLSS